MNTMTAPITVNETSRAPSPTINPSASFNGRTWTMFALMNLIHFASAANNGYSRPHIRSGIPLASDLVDGIIYGTFALSVITVGLIATCCWVRR